jgi:large subunit ribosomal protein L18
MKKNIKAVKRIRRHAKIRTRVSGTGDIPRLAVFRSNKFIYAQLIDDERGVTLASASTRDLKGKAAKVVGATEAGKTLAEKAKTAKIKKVVFDRGGFAFKGRVKALAEGAREGGLTF